MPLQRTRLLPTVRAGLLFDGVDDRAVVTNSPSLNPTSGATWMFWAILRRGDGRYKAIIAKYGYDSNLGTYTGWDFYIDPFNIFVFYFRYPHNVSIADYDVIFNAWTHYALVNNGSYSWLYRNGVLIAEKDMVLPSPTSHDVTIGSRREALYGDHIVGSVLIYSRALTAEEILWNYYYPDNPVRNGLVLWLHWDSIDTANNRWYDKSDFGNHSTLYGNPLKEDMLLPPKRTLSPTRTLAPTR